MDRIEYFEELKKTSNTVKPIIGKYLGAISQKQEGLYANIMFLASERMKKDVLLLKPFLVRLSYEITGGKDWERIAPICAAAEIINISSYQSNLSFDGKLGQTQITDRSNQFISSMITRELASDIAYDMKGILDLAQIEKIVQSFGESNKHIYVGQYCDLNVLTWNSFQMFNDFASYIRLYTERCDNLSGVFSEQCAFIGGILSDASEEEISALKRIGRNFGIGLHIANDIGDFVPHLMVTNSSFKESSDQFNDLRHGKLTLPIMHAFVFGNDMQRNILENIMNSHTILAEEEIKVAQLLLQTGSIAFSKNLIKAYWRKVKLMLKKFPFSRERSLLSVMLSQLRTNKYFYFFQRTNNGGSHKSI